MKIDRVQEINIKVLMTEPGTDDICGKMIRIAGMTDVEMSGSANCMDKILNEKNGEIDDSLRLDIFKGLIKFEDIEE